MATKSVDSNAAKLPQTRGISIIIDQAQQQQQQHFDSVSSTTSKIAISPNISTTYSSTTTVAQSNCNSTNNSNNERKTNLNNGSDGSSANCNTTTRYSTTFIDINRNEDDDQNTRTGLTRSKHNAEKESTIAEVTTISTFPKQQQQQQQMLNAVKATTSSQDQVNGYAGTPSSERRKTKVNVEEVAKKAEETTNGLGKVAASAPNVNGIGDDGHFADDDGMGLDVGICITHEHHEDDDRNTESIKSTQKKSADNNDVLLLNTSSSRAPTPAVAVTTTTVIACNNIGEQQQNFNGLNHHNNHQNFNHHEHSNDNDVVESYLSGSSGGEYFSKISVGACNGSSDLTVGAAAVAAGINAPSNSSFWPQLENNVVAAHSSTKSLKTEIAPDCASALTETQANADEQNSSLVVKIKISTNDEHNGEVDKVLSPYTESNQSSVVSENRYQGNNTSQINLASGGEQKSQQKVTVVQLNESPQVYQTPTQLKLKILDDKMVQKPCATQNGQSNANGNGNGNGNTTVTELNVPNQSSTSSSSYLYYMMSSGQFSPCDTLDSGTGSDLENNIVSSSPPLKMQTNVSSGKNGNAPKLELHLKTTKIRLNSGATNNGAVKEKSHKTSAVGATNEHLRAGSLTDSEESESSLSCDSLNSSEFLRLNSNSPTSSVNPQSISSVATTPATPNKSNGAFLPDSLLRDIRDRKFPTNDFVSKYVDNNNPTIYECVDEPATPTTPLTRENFPATSSGPLNFTAVQEAVAHAKYVRERNNSNLFFNRASLPSKTFVLNTHDGTFVDTKLNSMPRKYEADKYYNFHVREHENFRSFGNESIGNGGDLSDNGDGCSEAGSWTDYETKSMTNDDAFAGYKDIRCSSGASTIRSSKGTVRGVKNRVRNGIATFLQLQQPNIKNYKEKDLGKVVLYTTSMGIIRDTYAKCSNVKQILRTLLVKFEERDVFMSVEYQQEIKERMHSEAIKVPQLFVEGQHIGDADTVERLNESGELRQLLKPYKSISTTYTCQTCGGYRLLPCPSCNGSKKSVHRNHFTAEFVALKCMNCDEVGLVKCHNC